MDFHLIILTRIIAAIVFGFGIGLERELTNKYAGLRTHILVCLGACVFTILSIFAFPTAVDSTHPQAFGDPARIAAQIIPGIGFIGGGTVLRHGSSVYGLTTAATLWVAASIGMACGSGMISIALWATVFSVAVLVLIRLFERKVLVTSAKNTTRLKIIATCDYKNAEIVHNYIIENFDFIHEISRKQENNEAAKIVAVIDTSIKNPVKSLYKNFENLECLDSLLIQENNE